MVCTALILLTISPPQPITSRSMTLPVCLMISREITMSALREWAAAAGGAAHKAVKVNSYGKWKTALQMVSMSALLVLRQPHADLLRLPFVEDFMNTNRMLTLTLTAFWAMWLATALALWSLYIYMSSVWTHFIYPTKAH
mmetsp:Transcript_13841/g.24245  ORF Transcript_13841/g.24245 Transcript_13841/m.24245 type:complete len:140 (+) Transcript_13841:1-420(+)